jgi:hypothetical protein
VKGNIETKYVSYRPYNNASGLLNNTNFTSAINSSTEAYALIPPITIGSGDHQRDGNVIAPTSLTLKGWVSIAANEANSWLCDVDIYILRHKAIRDVAYETQLGNLNDLLNAGNGLNVGYDGSWTHSAFPINTSTYTLVKHKRIRLTKAYGDQQTYLSGGNPDTLACYSTAPFTKNFSFKVRMPKLLKYKNDTDTTPSMDYPFMVIGFNSPTNLTAETTLNRIQAQATTHMYYKDA